MGVVLDIFLEQTADPTLVYLTDFTGAYSAGNLTGWGAPNDDVAFVTSVTIGGTFRPYPCNAPALIIPPVTLMPSSEYPLPDYLWQEFQITPTLLALPSSNFCDGIYLFVYSVNTTVLSFTTSVIPPSDIGQIVTNFTTGKILGTLFSIVTGTDTSVITLINLTGYTISAGNVVLINGLQYETLIGGTPTMNTYTQDIQFYYTANSDCCLGNNLDKLDPFCRNCGDIDKLYVDGFITLMAGKSQAGCSMNNNALDTLFSFNKNFCNGCGCN